MSETENIERVIRALRKVPPVKLRIIELANEIPVDKNGVFDQEVLSEKSIEIREAVEEAKMYGTYTLQAVYALSNISRRGPDAEP